MIRGIGVDIVRCSRMEGKERRFYERFLSAEELRHEVTAEYAASRFAAKEAFSKALGTGIRGFSMKEVSVVCDDLGRPSFRLEGNAEALARGLALHLSISHEREYAVDMVVADEV